MKTEEFKEKYWEQYIIESINNKIKTLRRQAYAYHDDEYFFLKILDMSRK